MNKVFIAIAKYVLKKRVDVFDVDPEIEKMPFEFKLDWPWTGTRREIQDASEETLKREMTYYLNQKETRFELVSHWLKNGYDLKTCLPEDDIYWRRLKEIDDRFDKIAPKPRVKKLEDYVDEKMQDKDFKKAYQNLDLPFQISRSIVEARQRLGISQEQLAQKTGMSLTKICKIEAAEANPRIKTLKRIAKALVSWNN